MQGADYRADRLKKPAFCLQFRQHDLQAPLPTLHAMVSGLRLIHGVF
jgi:hypothetical protein